MSPPDAGPNPKLLAAIPPNARRVLELGCGHGQLGRRYKQLYPRTHWTGVDAAPAAAAAAAAHLDRAVALDCASDEIEAAGTDYDVIVIGALLEHLGAPVPILARLHALRAPGACIVVCLPNMAHAAVLERLIAGDLSYDETGLLDSRHTRFFTQSSAFKALLDGGWLPHLQDQYRVEPAANPFLIHLAGAAQTLGIPPATALRNLGMYQMIIRARKWDCAHAAGRADYSAQSAARAEVSPASTTAAAPAPFSVIVAINRPWQFELNVARSPGLREIGADIVPVQGASTAAAAYARGCAAARHAWRVFAHQDVYFPAGSGWLIAHELARRAGDTAPQQPLGFAGLHADSGLDAGLRPGGLVIDRTACFDHPASARAVSVDEFACILHAQCPVQIDPDLGWHLWATDLCLQCLERGQAAGLLRVPLFHNSSTSFELPAEFHASARVLLAKHTRYQELPTLCGKISRGALPGSVGTL